MEYVIGSICSSKLLQVYAYCGRCNIRFGEFGPIKWKYKSEEFSSKFASLNSSPPHFAASVSYQPRTTRQVLFPIWYASLVLALASVGVLRFRRQFSIRSALVATTVVAALVGLAVIL
jgi:hypothetical protein